MEVLVRFKKEGLPTPGAVGIVSAPPFSTTGDSDSENFFAALTGNRPPLDANEGGSVTLAALEPEGMVRFPDTLFIAATRDQFLSSMAVAQSRLVRLGIQADLHVWEGLTHGFSLEADLPESREANEVIARFFDKHLSGD